MSLLTRAAILAAEDLKSIDVPCPEWGGDVRLRSLTAAQKDDFDASLGEFNAAGTRVVNLHNMRAKLLAVSIVGEDGEPLFTATDIESLGAKSSAPIGRLFEAAQRLNGMLPDAVEAAAKN